MAVYLRGLGKPIWVLRISISPIPVDIPGSLGRTLPGENHWNFSIKKITFEVRAAMYVYENLGRNYLDLTPLLLCYQNSVLTRTINFQNTIVSATLAQLALHYVH